MLVKILSTINQNNYKKILHHPGLSTKEKPCNSGSINYKCYVLFMQAMTWLFEGIISHQLISLLLLSTSRHNGSFSLLFSFCQNIFSFLEDKRYYTVWVTWPGQELTITEGKTGTLSAISAATFHLPSTRKSLNWK